MLNVKLAFRYSKMGGAKTAIAFIGVFFASFIFAIISLFSSSVINSLQYSAFQKYGGYHVMFAGESDKIINKFTNDHRISEYAFIYLRNYETTDEGVLWDVFDVSENWTEFVPEHLVKGHFPCNEGQVVIHDYLSVENSEVYAVGAILKGPNGEDFEIVGTYDLEKMLSIFGTFGIGYDQRPAFFSVSKRNNLSLGSLLLAKLDPISSLQAVGDNYGWDNVIANRQYLDVCSPSALGDSTFRLIQNVKKVVYGITLVVSVLFIGSAFSVLFSNNINELSLLSAIGASFSQVSSIMLCQAIIISTFALVPGILLALGAILAFSVSLGNALEKITGTNIELIFAADYRAIIVIIILTYVTAVLAMLVSLVGIRKSLPFALRRVNRVEKIPMKKGRSRHSGIVGILCKRYEHLHCAKNIIIIVSISMAMVLYLIFIVAVRITSNDLLKEYNNRWCDISTYVFEENDELFFQWYHENFEKDSRLENAYWILENGSDDVKRTEIGLSEEWDRETDKILSVIYVDNKVFEKYCTFFGYASCNVESILTANDSEVVFDRGESVIVYTPLYSKPEMHEVYFGRLGETYNTLCVNKDEFKKVSTLFGSDAVDYLIIPYSSYKSLANEKSWRVIAFSEEYLEIERDLTDKGIYVNNIRKSLNDDLSQVNTWNTFANVFIVMLSVILFSYMLFSIYTYALMRKRDYVVLKSLGMDGKQQKKMFVYEAAVNIIGVLCFGGTLSVIAVGLFSYLLRTSIFMFPVLEAGICLLLICGAYVIAYFLAYRVMNRVNIVDEIR